MLKSIASRLKVKTKHRRIDLLWKKFRKERRSGNIVAAETCLDNFLELYPNSYKGWIELARFNENKNKEKAYFAYHNANQIRKLKKNVLYKWGVIALNIKQDQIAYKIFDQFCSNYAEIDPRAFYYLATAGARLGLVGEARLALKKLESSSLNTPDKFYLLGRGFRMIGQADRALFFFDEYDKSGNPTASELNIYGRTALSVGRIQLAIQLFKRAIALTPNPIESSYYLLEAQRQHGDIESNSKFLENLDRLHPHTVDDYFFLARSYVVCGSLDRAQAVYDQAAAAEVDLGRLRFVLAEFEYKQGLLTQSVERLRQIAEDQPDYVKATFLLGRILNRWDRTDEATACLEKTIELQPQHTGALFLLSSIRRQEGKTEEAVKFLDHALKYDPSSSRMLLAMASIHLQEGRYEEAHEYATKVKRIIQDSFEADQIIETALLFHKDKKVSNTITIIAESNMNLMPGLLNSWRTIVYKDSIDLWKISTEIETDWVVFLRPDMPIQYMRRILDEVQITTSGVYLFDQQRVIAIQKDFLVWSIKTFSIGESGKDSVLILEYIKSRGLPVLGFSDTKAPDRALLDKNRKGMVLLISGHGPVLFGGAERFLRDMAEIYRAIGFTPVLVGLHADSDASGITEDGISYFEFSRTSREAFRTFLFEQVPSLAHLVTGVGYSFLSAARGLDIPTVYGTHFWRDMFNGEGSFLNIDRQAFARPEFSGLVNEFTALYANSTYTLEMQYTHHRVLSRVIFSLPEDVGLKQRATERQTITLINSKPEKGFGLFLELAKRHPEYTFLTIANQSSLIEAKETIKENGLFNVDVISRVKDMGQIYRRSICVLVPSYRFIETFSRAVIEAHRYGVPVVGSDRGNVPRLLEQSGVSLPEDVEAWSAEISKLCDQPAYWADRSKLAVENSKRYSFTQQFPIIRSLAKQASNPVLIAVGSGIGNIIQCTPAIRKLSEFFGQPVDIVINQDFEGCEWIFENSRFTSLIFSSESPYIKRRYSEVIILGSFGRSIPKFNSKNTHIARYKRPFTQTHYIHEAHYNLKCIADIYEDFEFEEDDIGNYFIGDRKPNGLDSNVIVVHAGGKGGRWLAKRWPYFEQLAKLLQEAGWEVHSVGSSEEYVEGCVNRTGLDLRETIEVIQKAAYMVANDSGCMHVADGMGIPLTAIFAPTSITKNRPLSSTSQVISLEKECAPCQFSERMSTCNCISEIPVSLVADRVLSHLSALKGTSNKTIMT